MDFCHTELDVGPNLLVSEPVTQEGVEPINLERELQILTVALNVSQVIRQDKSNTRHHPHKRFVCVYTPSLSVCMYVCMCLCVCM